MNFKIWLENIESAEDITKKYSSIILSSSTYQDAVQNLSKVGVAADFDANRHSGLGHKWKEVFYKVITGDQGGGILTPEKNPELASKLQNLASNVSSMGFPSIDSNEPWYFFGIEGYKSDGANKKLHIKIPVDKLNLALKLAEFIKQNSANVRQFKFASKGSSFESRRDNFVIYLSKQGEANIGEFAKGINALGLATDTGEDFKGDHGSSLSQTELVSLRLAAMLVSRPGNPEPKFANSSHWQVTEKKFLESDPVGSKYLNNDSSASSPATTAPKSSQPQEYQPKTLVLSGAGGRPVTINIDTVIGKTVLRQSLGDQAQYFSDPQFQIKKSNDGWYLVPNNTAVNKTIINGRPASGSVRINLRDRIGVVGKSGNQITPISVTSV